MIVAIITLICIVSSENQVSLARMIDRPNAKN